MNRQEEINKLNKQAKKYAIVSIIFATISLIFSIISIILGA
jgi:hypothetical protein